MNTHLYPLFLDLAERKVLVVGAGAVALRKVRSLLESGAQVSVVAPAACHELRALVTEGRVTLAEREFCPQDADGAVLVFAATGNAATDGAVAEAARRYGGLVNLADAPDDADFIVPASGRRGVIHVAVSTSGTSPGLAVRLRDRFLGSLAPEWERFAELLGKMRAVGHEVVPDAALRRSALSAAAADDDLLAQMARDVEIDPAEALRAQAARSATGSGDAMPAGPTGRAGDPAAGSFGSADVATAYPRAFVSLVGAGPGEPGLLTVAGADRIASADVIVYDDLVDRRTLALAPSDAELVYAGKRGWREGPERPVTGELLVQRATEGGGRRVVRLKGGDPMVFGRAGEEMATLEACGVAYEIIPGVTAALAAAAGSRIPLTLRGVSNSLTLVAGNSAAEPAARETGLGEAVGESGPPIASLASAALSGGTLCVYMGLKGLAEIASNLTQRGVSAGLPVAVVEQAGTEKQRCVSGTLETIAQVVKAAGVRSPALVIIGRVIDYAPGCGGSAR